MNKRIAISISIVLAAVIVVTGVLYAQETGKLKDAQSEIAGLAGNVSTLEGNVSALEIELIAVEAEVTRLGGELIAAQAQVLTLEADLATAEAEVLALEGNVSALEANVSALQTELSDSKATVSTLEGTIVVLEADMAAAEAEVLALKGNVSALEGNISALATELAEWEAEVSTLEIELAAALDSTKVYMLPGLMFGSAVFPTIITVPVGTTVTWMNLSNEVHTTTITTNPKLFDSGIIAPGDSFSYTFTQPGVFNYNCEEAGCNYHSLRNGIVIVE